MFNQSIEPSFNLSDETYRRGVRSRVWFAMPMREIQWPTGIALLRYTMAGFTPQFGASASGAIDLVIRVISVLEPQ